MIGNNVEMLAVDEAHFARFVETEAKLTEALMGLDAREQSDNEESSRLLTMQDGLAVIEIKGGLVNRDSWINKYYGLVSYNEIRQAMIEAVDNGAAVIMFSIDSPGGNVNGLSDVANFMSKLPVKTIAFTSSQMASAAYFFGSQADYLYADSFAEVGSIGVIVKMYDRSKMLAEIGVKPMRFRSGKLKAVGDPDFKLTSEEKTYIQGKVMNFAGKFYNIVSEARGLPLAAMDKLGVTSGQTFIGDESVKVGLVDSIKTFDESMLKAFDLVKKEVDKRHAGSLSYR